MKTKKSIMRIPAILLALATAAALFLVLILAFSLYAGIAAIIAQFQEIIGTVFSFKTVMIVSIISAIVFAVAGVRQTKARSYARGIAEGKRRKEAETSALYRRRSAQQYDVEVVDAIPDDDESYEEYFKEVVFVKNPTSHSCHDINVM